MGTFGRLASVVGGAQRDVREHRDAEAQRMERERQRQIQEAALLAGLRGQGIIPEEEREPIILDAAPIQETPSDESFTIRGPVGIEGPRVSLPTQPRAPSGGIGAQRTELPNNVRYKSLGGTGFALDSQGTPQAVAEAHKRIQERNRQAEIAKRSAALAAHPKFKGASPELRQQVAESDEAWNAALKSLTEKPSAPVAGTPEWFAMQKGLNDLRVGGQKDVAAFSASLPSRSSPGQVDQRVVMRTNRFASRFDNHPTVKNAAAIAEALGRIRSAAADGSGAGDMNLLFAYMKLLDPNSVVRESEFATAAKSGSLPQQIQGYASRVANGQRLTPEQRKAFVAAADRLAREQHRQMQSVTKQLGEQARRAGVDPADFALDPYEGLFESEGGAKGTDWNAVVDRAGLEPRRGKKP